MKVVYAVFVLGAMFSSTVAVLNHPEIFQRFENFSKNCLEDLKLELRAVTDFYDGVYQHQDEPKDENVLCYYKCMVQRFKWMNEDGDIIENTEEYPDDIIQAVNKCKETTGKTPCDKGFRVAKCFMDAMKDIHEPKNS